MKTILLSSLAALSLAITCNSGIAQTNDMQGQLSSKDYKFVKEAAKSGQMDITLGQIATQNAEDPAVHDFGAKMVQDCQAANADLTKILAQKGAAVSGAPGWLDKRIIDHLQGLKGGEFDKAYMKDMVKYHQEDIKVFQEEAANGEDADIRNFANTTLPTLQEHLRTAQDIDARLNPTASN